MCEPHGELDNLRKRSAPVPEAQHLASLTALQNVVAGFAPSSQRSLLTKREGVTAACSASPQGDSGPTSCRCQQQRVAIARGMTAARLIIATADLARDRVAGRLIVDQLITCEEGQCEVVLSTQDEALRRGDPPPAQGGRGCFECRYTTIEVEP